jgi:shikimate kinase
MLVGLMGAGKTTVGRAITARTGWTYVDNDLVLERLAGRPTAEVADALGWDGLHDLEIDALAAVLDSPAPFVAGAAASVVDRVEGRALLREAYVIYLRARVETLVARVGDGAGRPWLSGDVKGFIEAQTAKRGALFEQVASLVLDVDDNDANLAASRIVASVLAH